MVELQDGETVIGKKFPGAFEQTELNDTLKSWGIEKVVLVGYMAHVVSKHLSAIRTP